MKHIPSRYALKPGLGDDAAKVEINPLTGQVTPKESQEAIPQSLYRFTVVATDPNNPHLTREKTVTLSMHDLGSRNNGWAL